MPSPGGALLCHLKVGRQLCPDTGSEGEVAVLEPGVHPSLGEGAARKVPGGGAGAESGRGGVS